MTKLDITIIQEWLLSGGPYTSYTEPARFIKLLLDNETGRVLSTMLLSKCTDDNRYIGVENIVDTLNDLISSRKTLSTRRKEFFGSYNTPGLMGKEGNKIDGFVARLSRDVTACKLEKFRWTDYQIFLCINTFVTSDRDKVRLAEKLTKINNAHWEANTSMTLASIQMEVKKFWRDKKETKDLMYKGSTKPGPGNNTARNKERRKSKKDRKKSNTSEFIAQVASGKDKSKDTYCFLCGDPAHVAKDCPKKGDLKCKVHPTSTSHTDLACFYYRKSQNLPIATRPRPDGSKDSTRGHLHPTIPESGNRRG